MAQASCAVNTRFQEIQNKSLTRASLFGFPRFFPALHPFPRFRPHSFAKTFTNSSLRISTDNRHGLKAASGIDKEFRQTFLTERNPPVADFSDSSDRRACARPLLLCQSFYSFLICKIDF